MDWTREEEERIQRAVEERQRARREKEMDAEVERRVLKAKHGWKAVPFKFLSRIREIYMDLF